MTFERGASIVAALFFACHAQPDVTNAADADDAAPAIAGPTGWNRLTEATAIELRDTHAKGHDVAVRLEREQNDFAWTAKVSAFPFSLGEQTLDPSGTMFVQCRCEVGIVCPCEVKEHAVPAPVIERGRISATVVDAFLKALSSRSSAANADGGTRSPSRFSHVGVFVPGAEMIHVSVRDEAWMANGRAIDGDGAALDASLDAVLDALGVAKLVPPPPALPSGFATMASKASVVEIKDSWNGLGRTHDAFIRLERTGASFTWKAKAAAWINSVGERLPDPTSSSDAPACVCDVQSSCPCEKTATVLRKSGTIASSLVEAFLDEVCKHAIATADDDRPRGFWTDDYPRAHVVVVAGSDVIHLSFPDQQRRWRVNGADLALDAPPPAGERGPRAEHPAINSAYQENARRDRRERVGRRAREATPRTTAARRALTLTTLRRANRVCSRGV